MQAFGRYQLEQRIGIGGMGEVFAGKVTGAEGFERPCALKVILPELCDDPEFQKMFVDEAKISMHLQHANIVQVLDLGEVGGRYFLAMEYVEGPSLSRVQRLLQKRGQLLPVPLAVYVLIELLRGLDHAHKARDRSGNPLGIVHRDVTPQNVLVSMAGEVKLSDFGIARASTRMQRTETGVVRGKLAYLAPEQFDSSASVGVWTDVYAAGMVLVNLLLGKSPLAGLGEGEIIARLRSLEPLPIEDSRIPAGLGGILRRAIAPDYRLRFPTAQSFQEALEEFVLANRIKTGARHLADFLQQLAADEARERGVELPPAAAGAPNEVPTVATPSKGHDRSLSLALVMGTIDPAGPAPIPSAPVLAPPVPAAAVPATPSPALPEPASRASPIAVATAAAAVVMAGAVSFAAGRWARSPAPIPLPPIAARAGALPDGAAIGWLFYDPHPWADCSIDGRPAGSTPLVAHPLEPGRHVLECRSVDGTSIHRELDARPGRPVVVR